MDSQSKKFILKFVEIVKRHPVLYDTKLPQRTAVSCNETWEEVADEVRNETQYDYPVEELKLKWKGIRSSFTRFKKKAENSNKGEKTKEYYLYEPLKFLHPYIKKRSLSHQDLDKNDDHSSEGEEWDSEISEQVLNEDTSDHTNFISNLDNVLLLPMRSRNLGHPEVKIEPIDENEPLTSCDSNDRSHVSNDRVFIKRKSFTDASEATSSKSQKTEENADLQFFKSIMPDIENFTKLEKRKFKMGVLNLIDDIENGRRDVKY